MRGGGMPHRIIAISRPPALPTNGQSWLGYDWVFNGGDWPLAFVTFDGNSQPVEFIKPNAFHRPGFSIA
jgi:hypothetical protein